MAQSIASWTPPLRARAAQCTRWARTLGPLLPAGAAPCISTCPALPAVQLGVGLAQRDARWHCERSYVETFGGRVQLFFIDTNPFIARYHEDSWGKYDGGIVQQSWEEQLRELERRLAASTAQWKIMVSSSSSGPCTVAYAEAGPQGWRCLLTPPAPRCVAGGAPPAAQQRRARQQHRADAGLRAGAGQVRRPGGCARVLLLCRRREPDIVCTQQRRRPAPLIVFSTPPPAQAYFSGHDHNLEHLHLPDLGLHYIVAGGGSDCDRGFVGGASSLYQHPYSGFVAATVSRHELTVNFFTLESSTRPAHTARIPANPEK